MSDEAEFATIRFLNSAYQWGMLFVASWLALFLGGCAWGWMLKFG